MDLGVPYFRQIHISLYMCPRNVNVHIITFPCTCLWLIWCHTIFTHADTFVAQPLQFHWSMISPRWCWRVCHFPWKGVEGWIPAKFQVCCSYTPSSCTAYVEYRRGSETNCFSSNVALNKMISVQYCFSLWNATCVVPAPLVVLDLWLY